MELDRLLYIMITTIEELWDSFYEKTIPDIDENSAQYIETKKAFYAGCVGMFTMVIQITNQNSKDVAEIYLDNLQKEIDQFITDIQDD
jgi:hypothetical protein